MSQATVTLALNASQFDAALQAAQKNLQAFAGKIGSSFSGSLVGQLGGIAAGVVGVGAAFATLQRSLAGGVQLNAQLEQTRISVATLLNQFDGSRFADFNDRMRESDKILKSLREKGLYAEATFAQLSDTLQMTAGGMFTAGIKDGEKQVDMIVAVSQALAALGGDQANLASELRSLTTGNVDGWHRVAKAIGMSGEQLRKAQADGTLFESVMAKMKPILVDAGQGMGTFQSQMTILQENLDNLKTDLAQPMFEAFKAGLQEINGAFSGDQLKEGLSGVASEFGRIAATAMSMAAEVLKALPAIIQVGSTLMSALVPALVAVGYAKLTASAKAQTLNTSLMTLGQTGIASASRAWQTFQYNMLFTPTVTGKVIQSFRLMSVSIMGGLKAMAASAAGAFKAMAASGQLAALAIQGALAGVTFAFTKAMEWANEKNQTTDEQQSIMKEGTTAFKSNINRVSKVGSEKEKEEIKSDLGKQREEIRDKMQEVASSDKSDSNKGVLLEQYQRELQAIDMVEKSLDKVTAARMRQNLLAKEAAAQAEKEAAEIEKLRDKVKDANKDLGDSQEKSRFESLGDSEKGISKAEAQRGDLFKQAFGNSYSLDSGTSENQELDKQIGSLQSKFDNNTATQYEAERLLKLIGIKKDLIGIEKELGKEKQQQAANLAKFDNQIAEKQATSNAKSSGDINKVNAVEDEQKKQDMASQLVKDTGITFQDAIARAEKMLSFDRAQREKDLADKRSENEKGIKVKELRAAGKDKEADKIEETQKRDKIFEEQKGLGYSPKQAMQNANQQVALDKALAELPKANQRSENERDIQIKEAKVKGDSKKVTELEDNKKREKLVKEQKDMGYGDKEAKQNADKIMSLDKILEQRQNDKKGPLAVSSTMSVGGGGVSVGVGGGLLDENKKQTRLLQQIANAIANPRMPSRSTSMQPINPWESNS
jgi:hypothetical protein